LPDLSAFFQLPLQAIAFRFSFQAGHPGFSSVSLPESVLILLSPTFSLQFLAPVSRCRQGLRELLTGSENFSEFTFASIFFLVFLSCRVDLPD
jgi:hypothetical protein